MRVENYNRIKKAVHAKPGWHTIGAVSKDNKISRLMINQALPRLEADGLIEIAQAIETGTLLFRPITNRSEDRALSPRTASSSIQNKEVLEQRD